MELANTTLPFEGFVIDGPPPFEVLGIGGFVSPQRLSGAGYVVLDFPRSRLVALDGDEAEVTRWLAAYGEPAAVPTTWSRNKPFVEVALAPRGTVLGELDTGGSGSEVSAGYAGEQQAESAACQGIGVSGTCVRGATLEKQTVLFARKPFFLGRSLSVLDAISYGDQLSNEHMLVGMDVLRSCTLAVPQDRKARVLARCAAR